MGQYRTAFLPVRRGHYDRLAPMTRREILRQSALQAGAVWALLGQTHSHTDARYPSTKALVGTYGNDWARRVRFTPANARIIGEADGIIMAIIITAHMANSALRSAALQGFMLTMQMA